DARGARRDTIARDIGRSLVMIPGARAFTYLQRGPAGWSLLRAELGGAGAPETSTLAAMPAGADYVVWLSPRLAITAAGSSILSWSPGQTGWGPAADLSAAGLARASRLAVSPDGKWLAIVAEPAAP